MPTMTLSDIEDAVQLSDVMARAKETHSWSDEDMNAAKSWYLKHLFLAKKYPERSLAAISKRADELWHQHILDTPKYARDCEKLFGRFIHHQPVYGEPNQLDTELHNETVALYETEFGSAPPDISRLSAIPY